MNMHFRLYLLLLLLLSAPLTAQQVMELTILHYNDFHAQNLPTTLSAKSDNGERVKKDAGGSATLKGAIDQFTAAAEHVILLHAGDDFQGTPISSITKGRSQFELLELIQPDAMTLGNHEFDYGADNIRTLLPTVTFPIVSANLWDKSTGTPFVPRYRILRRGGMRIGVIGLAPSDLATLTLRENVSDLDVLDPVMTVRQTIAELETNFGVRFIVVLSHMGVDQDSALASAVPGIDVIVGGHSHSALFVPKRVGETVIVQAGSKGRWLGRLVVKADVEAGTVLSSRGELVPLYVDELPSDPIVAAKVAELEAVVDAGFGEVIGTLTTSWERYSGAESNIGNWQSDVMRDFAKADVAFQNSGGIRKDLSAGPITLRDMWEISPFGNEFVTFEVTGAQLLSMIRYQATVTGEFCQVSGIRYTYDYTADETNALKAEVGGKPVQPETKYTIVTNNYVGGHLHDVFGLSEAAFVVSEVYPTHVDRDVYIDYVRAQKQVASSVEGRINLIGERQ
jgi:5'-nucleotidase/UDP-sugar diphosphatase